MNSRYCFIATLLLLMSCVEPIDLELSDGAESQLVVEGWINNVNDIALVQLRTSTFDGVGPNTLGVDATVSISTGAGEVYLLEEVIPGLYATLSEPFNGTVGESYQLNIVSRNGHMYESTMETIPEPVAIGQTWDEFIENRGQTDNGTPFVDYSNDIYTELENTSEQHFVRFETFGWELFQVDYFLVPAGPLFCWQLQDPINRNVVLATNTGITGNTYETKIANVPVQFRGYYIVELAANSMTSEAFSFWAEAQRQLSRGGGIFDPPFAPVIGNIRNVDDPDEIVLGYFHAYAQTTSRYCYSREGLPGSFEIPIFPDGSGILCTDYYAPAVFELPFADELCIDEEG